MEAGKETSCNFPSSSGDATSASLVRGEVWRPERETDALLSVRNAPGHKAMWFRSNR